MLQIRNYHKKYIIYIELNETPIKSVMNMNVLANFYTFTK